MDMELKVFFGRPFKYGIAVEYEGKVISTRDFDRLMGIKELSRR